MGRRTSVIGVLVRAHARSVRERKAHERHQVAQARRYEQARAAAARAEAAEQRAAAIAEARDANARARAEKEAERQRIREEKDAERQAHLSAAEDAEQKTLEVGDTIAELQGLLAFTLQVDDRIDFNSLRIKERPPELSLPMLRLPNYVPDSSIADPIQPPHIEVLIKSRVKPPSFLEKLFRSSRFEREVAAVREEHERLVQRHRVERAAVAERRSAHRAKFDQDCQRLRLEHENAVSRVTQQHQQALRAFEAKRAQRDAEINELEESYRRGDPDSVVLYNEMVLSRSDYPAGFPQQFRLAY